MKNLIKYLTQKGHIELAQHVREVVLADEHVRVDFLSKTLYVSIPTENEQELPIKRVHWSEVRERAEEVDNMRDAIKQDVQKRLEAIRTVYVELVKSIALEAVDRHNNELSKYQED